MTMKFHSAVARALKDNGVDTMFGLIGDANLFMLDSFVRENRGNFVAAAHEAGATLMGLGYSAISGKTGVVTVTHGPALSNTMTALVEGVKASLPLVLICGDTAVEDRDHPQKIDQREFVLTTGAGFEPLRSPRTLAEDLATAFRRSAVERRPIALNVPVDFQWLDVEYQPAPHEVPERSGFTVSGPDLDAAAGIVAAAQRPIILAGRGAIAPAARMALLRLADRTGALVATSLKGKDLFRGLPYDLGIFGTLSSPQTLDAIMASDCVIAFGASLNRFTTDQGSLLRGKRVVNVNAEAGDVAKFARPDACVVGDPAAVAEAIVRMLDEAEIPSSGHRAGWLANTSGIQPTEPPAKPHRQGTVDFPRALRRLDEMVPDDRVVVTDAGRFAYETWKTVKTPDPRHYVLTMNSGSIGLGLPYAIGASVAAKDRPVLLITGDGGFMHGGLAEFNTAVRSKCDLIIVVFNDGSYGSEHVQFRDRGMDPGLAIMQWPELAPVAEALGGTGVTVRSMEELEAAALAIQRRKGPILIDVKIDPDGMPPRS
jgi:thiamine pyrophosphate-dependent acetolactate synthase large subunit-like protein